MPTFSQERLTPEEYVAFLARTDLGSQYPAERFESRIARLVANADVTVVARAEGEIVGVAMGVTDFAYFLFLTDLGVVRERMAQGIGRELLRRLVEAAGGPDDITVVTIAAEAAGAFYDRIGLKPNDDLRVAFCREWTDFTVGA